MNQPLVLKEPDFISFSSPISHRMLQRTLLSLMAISFHVACMHSCAVERSSNPGRDGHTRGTTARPGVSARVVHRGACVCRGVANAETYILFELSLEISKSNPAGRRSRSEHGTQKLVAYLRFGQLYFDVGRPPSFFVRTSC